MHTSGVEQVTDIRPYRTYFLRTVGLSSLCVLFSALVIVGTKLHGRSDLPFKQLINYQIAKMDFPITDTVFLGDSSLGNAISANEWRRLSGNSTTNFALTGVYGYAGSHAMLQEILERGTPRNVILMHAVDIATRPIDTASLELLGLLERNWVDRVLYYIKHNLNIPELEASARYIMRQVLPSELLPKQPVTLHDDYIVQGEPRTVSTDAIPPAPEKVRAEQIQYLRKIAKLCETNKINCVYAHGPLASPLCERAFQYLHHLSKRITEAGLNLVWATPVCIRPGEIGDSSDHVAPGFKSQYTRRYYELLSWMLVAAGPTSGGSAETGALPSPSGSHKARSVASP